MNLQEARAAFSADLPHLAARGVHLLPGAMAYVPEQFRHNFALAMDAQPALVTNPNSAIPAFLTTMVDPEVIRVLFAPSKAAEIIGEQKKGTWTDQTAMFPVVEQTGEVSSYGDYAENGHVGVNESWPQRQAYLFQTIKEIGDLELERAGLGKINFVAETDMAAAVVMTKYQNLTYFFGVSGLQNYGLLNDPSLSAAITPATKVATGTEWFTNTGAPNATANEVYNDIVALFAKLIAQSAGVIDKDASFVLAMSPGSSLALTFTNTFNVNVEDLLKKNFKNLRIVTAVQYGVTSATNPNGVAAGNEVQLICESVEGVKSAYCAFNEKSRSHPIVRALSSFKQKMTGGTWGAIIRRPFAIASMVGV